RACRAGQTDPRPCFPARCGQAEWRELLQLQRHSEARQPAERTLVTMSGPVRVAYDTLIAANELKPDAAQAAAVAALDRLATSIRPGGGLFSRLLGAGRNGPGGVYLWGGVGRGKSML